jgi:hypothetical protein
MDPKMLNSLDQNLRDKYDRVMNTPVTAVPQANQTVQTPVDPVLSNNLSPSPQMPTQHESPSPLSQSSLPDESNTFASAATHSFTPAFTSADSTALQNADSLAQQSMPGTQDSLSQSDSSDQSSQTSALIRIIYVLAAIVFLVLYTFVWIKIFNLQLPF